ncbi:MAG: SprB repeat-containing protein, partial [Bacteroidales bacterium]|nr:SprB repeat-containing protein [Bacteroidales bacterium]
MQHNTYREASGPRQSSVLSLRKLAAVLLLVVTTMVGKNAIAQDATATICLGQTKTITASVTTGSASQYTYTWANAGDGSGFAGAVHGPKTGTGRFTDAITVTPTAPGEYTYTVTITDNNTCSQVKTAKLIVNPLPTLTETHTPITCHNANDGTITVTAASGTADYQFSKDNGTTWVTPSPSTATSYTFNNLGGGTYNIKIKDGNECISLATEVLIENPAALNITDGNIVPTQPLCYNGNGSIQVTVTGGRASYQFALDNEGTADANYSAAQASPTFTFPNVAAGVHTIYVKDASGCKYNRTYTLAQPTEIAKVSESKTQPTCYGGDDGQITVVVTGGTVVSTSVAPYYQTVTLGGNAPNSSSVSGSNYTFTFTGLAANGSGYTLYIKDKNNCEKSFTITLGQPTAVVPANITASATTVCSGTEVTLSSQTATGGTPGTSPAYTYTWTASAGLAPAVTTATAPAVTAATHTPTATTNPVTVTYTLTARDSKGCTGEKTINVTVNPLPTVAINPSTLQNVCLNTAITSMTVTSSNGTVAVSGLPAGVTYNAGTGVISGSPTESGTFTVTATCTSGYDPECTPAATASMTIHVYDDLAATDIAGAANYCLNGTATALSTTASGGSGEYDYQWQVSTDGG